MVDFGSGQGPSISATTGIASAISRVAEKRERSLGPKDAVYGWTLVKANLTAIDCDSMGQDLWVFEKKSIDNGFSRIAGIDEAGRGPLAGPVVSAAVILPNYLHIPGISDSKKLTPKKRAYLYDKIYDRAISIGIGIVDPPEIDRINILQAALLSMAMASENLAPQPDCLLIDGIFKISSTLPQEPIPKGDARSISIAAASIIAKVTRDRLMERYHQDYPQFGFSKHKGYPTKAHKAAIRKFGSCPIHRQSFKGVKEYL